MRGCLPSLRRKLPKDGYLNGHPQFHQVEHYKSRFTERPSVLHGAPLPLRCENELSFKMVKWIAAIEFVHDFADLGAGQGGYNEDHEFCGYRMPI
jgi:hypothetical protein